jgi:hypothetical protein
MSLFDQLHKQGAPIHRQAISGREKYPRTCEPAGKVMVSRLELNQRSVQRIALAILQNE